MGRAFIEQESARRGEEEYEMIFSKTHLDYFSGSNSTESTHTQKEKKQVCMVSDRLFWKKKKKMGNKTNLKRNRCCRYTLKPFTCLA